MKNGKGGQMRDILGDDLKKKIHFLRAQNYKSNTEQSSQSWSFD